MTARRPLASCFFLIYFTLAAVRSAGAQEAEPRLALVIGNAHYAQPLASAANDAGLIAQTLQLAGFDVTAAADLDQVRLRQAVQGFVEDARRAGPGALIFVYLAGRGLQYAGENYFVPVNARIVRDADVPMQALRLSDLTRALATLSARAEIFVLDAARANAFPAMGAPLASGLALTEAAPGMLIAFNAAPGTIAPEEAGPYSAYARALAEMLSEAGVPARDIFARARVRANELTRGGVVPWDDSKIEPPLVLSARAPPALLPEPLSDLRRRPLRELPVQDAYILALERDQFEEYRAFLAAFASDPLAKRVSALLALRREALTWHGAFAADTPSAYWTYMRRYPRGPHLFDARRRLAALAAPLDPPPRFDPYEFIDLPPPPASDYAWVERRDLSFDLPDNPPPPLPAYLLASQPSAFAHLQPPTPQEGPGLLPTPVSIPMPSTVPPLRVGKLLAPHFGEPTSSADALVAAPPKIMTLPKPQTQSPAPEPTLAIPPSAQLSVIPPRRPAAFPPPAPAPHASKVFAASKPHPPPRHAKRQATPHIAPHKSAHTPPQKPHGKKGPHHR